MPHSNPYYLKYLYASLKPILPQISICLTQTHTCTLIYMHTYIPCTLVLNDPLMWNMWSRESWSEGFVPVISNKNNLWEDEWEKCSLRDTQNTHIKYTFAHNTHTCTHTHAHTHAHTCTHICTHTTHACSLVPSCFTIAHRRGEGVGIPRSCPWVTW